MSTVESRRARAASQKKRVIRNRARLLADPSLAPHGDISTYTNWGCTCSECKKAWRIWIKNARQRRKFRLDADSSLAVHGKSSTYQNWLCRCGPCTAAHTAERTTATGKRKS